MLCGLCAAIGFDELHSEWNPAGYAHHDNFAELASCTDCGFCSALHETIKDGPQLGKSSPHCDWRHLTIFLRLIPTSDAMGTDDDLSNLLVFLDPPAGQGGGPIHLAMFGLYLDRTEMEWKTGERYCHTSWILSLSTWNLPVSKRSDKMHTQSRDQRTTRQRLPQLGRLLSAASGVASSVS